LSIDLEPVEERIEMEVEEKIMLLGEPFMEGEGGGNERGFPSILVPSSLSVQSVTM